MAAQLFCDGKDRIQTSTLEAKILTVLPSSQLPWKSSFSFIFHSFWLPSSSCSSVKLWLLLSLLPGISGRVHEQDCPSHTVVFSLNFWTGMKTLLALKLREAVTPNWDLDLKLNTFVETQRFGNNSWTYLHRWKRVPLHAWSWLLYYLWKLSPLLSNKCWKPCDIVSMYQFLKILQRRVKNSKYVI